MTDRIRQAFDGITAGQELKDKTRERLAQAVGRQAGRARMRRRLALAAACLALCVGGAWLYLVPTVRIGVDINPSLELGVNRFDRVVSVKGLNDDGRLLAGQLDVRFDECTEAVEKILRNETVASLLAQDEVLSVTVVGEREDGQCQSVLAGVKACLQGHRNTHCAYMDEQQAQQARECGLSCGKYQAFLEAQALGASLTPEQAGEMSMRELRELIAALSQQGQAPQQGGGHGHHGGHGPQGGGAAGQP